MEHDMGQYEAAVPLLRRLCRRETEAFDELHCLLEPVLRHDARSRLIGRRAKSNLLDDVLQEVFLRIYRWPLPCQTGLDVFHWVHALLASALVQTVRTNRPQDAGGELDVLLADLRAPRETVRPTADLLSQLDPEQRRLLYLRYWRDRSYRAIARELGISVSAVGTRLHRLRTLLRDGAAQTPSDAKRAS